jgi:hypothetical protein
MEQATLGIRFVLTSFEQAPTVADALLSYVKKLEEDYRETQEILLFVFAVHTFFCWHRTSELLTDTEAVQRIKTQWIAENEEYYIKWLSSMKDDSEDLKWFKWTYQAKTSILNEFIEKNQAISQPIPAMISLAPAPAPQEQAHP